MKVTSKNYIMSLDAETDGLWGRPFAIAAVVFDTNKQEVIDVFKAHIDGLPVENSWVKENVIPAIELGESHSCDSLEALLKSFADFYMKWKSEAETIWHMGHIVETGLFRLLVEFKIIGEWDAPYTPLEVATLLPLINRTPDSTDALIRDGLILLDQIKRVNTHDPLYDCYSALNALLVIEKEIGA